jgi:uncharacterized membrane protein YbaN (DUF454 family)
MTRSELTAQRISAIYRLGFVILGILLVGIGILGIFLPLLPTTIFLILASACFIKGSPRMNQWLKNNKVLGRYVRNYQDKSGLTVKTKIYTIIFLWISISISAFFLTNEFAVQIILFLIAVGVTIHLIAIKTQKS